MAMEISLFLGEIQQEREECSPMDTGEYSPGSSHRRMSKDSGRCSLTPSVDGDTRRVSVDYSHYRRVSVDMDRKEELALAKAVRKSSVKIRRYLF